ncbi:MAG: peptidyl-prolyl cis-trans isomerase [Candidatus Omnitrophica bacterium]|nr:peptidyl-prolyl cis-trans isomerase [Candidatus Omnitrophota bacterium]
MKKIYILLIPGFVLFFSLVGCQGTSSSRPDAKVTESQINGPLLAQVDDWRIGLDDFEKSLSALEPIIAKENIKIDRDFKMRVLDELVNNALLAQEAKRRGLDQDKDVIEVVNRYKQTILAEKLKNDMTRDVYVSDKEVEDFYAKNKDSMKGLPEFKVREIAVDNEAKAKEIYMRLLQGEDFSTIALTASTIESAKRGGDLGYISYDPNKKFSKFWSAVAALDEGNISNIFKGEDGKFYIIKLESKREGEAYPLSKIKEEIKKRLEEVRKGEKIGALISASKQKSKVIINPDLLK